MATPFGEISDLSDAELGKTLDDYVALGARWLRTDFYWGDVQPERPNDYNWENLDRVIKAATERGLRLVGLPHATPQWATDGGGMRSEENIRHFAEFVLAAVKRYKSIKHWEIWNEQNLESFWDERPDPRAYANLLKVVYAAIKAEDASLTVIAGGLSPVPRTGSGHYSAVEYLARMYESGVKGSFDAVGFHPYSWPLMPDDPAPWNGWQMMENGIRQLMVRNGDGEKQIWMTEFGAPTNSSGGGVDEERQAEILLRAHNIARQYSWTGPLFWYSYKDRGGAQRDTENWYGIVSPNGNPKASYDVFRKITTSK